MLRLRSLSQIAASMALMLFSAALHADDPAEDEIKALIRVPDLSPALTSDEVDRVVRPWSDEVKSGWKKTWGDKFTASFLDVRRRYGPLAPIAEKITFYSLLPFRGALIGSQYPDRESELKKLPTFHEFPILGSLTISEKDAAERWSKYLKTQFAPAPVSFCDFMPRHGIRLTRDGKDVDLVICFQCGQMGVFGAAEQKTKVYPSFH